MLFYDTAFLYYFLPSVLLAYYALRKLGHDGAARAALVVGSLIFYGFWKWSYLTILCGSIVGNFFLGRSIRSAAQRRSAWLLTAAGIAGNVLLLAYYKYADFIVENTNDALGVAMALPNVVLPLAISFFTFQQIAWLADCYQRKVAGGSTFLEYALFVSFFPQLIAGPIVHHSEMMPQFRKRHLNAGLIARHLSIGFSIFVVGLFKKIVIADSCAAIATPAFNAGAEAAVSPLVAWVGLIAYTFQIYFDFLGYSDMAVGLGRMFGIRLPINFNSPYRAKSISDFLAALAHDAFALLAGLHIRSARRQQTRPPAAICEPCRHDADRRHLAWRVLEFLYLGRYSRRRISVQSFMERNGAKIRAGNDVRRRRMGDNIHCCSARLGVLQKHGLLSCFEYVPIDVRFRPYFHACPCAGKLAARHRPYVSARRPDGDWFCK